MLRNEIDGAGQEAYTKSRVYDSLSHFKSDLHFPSFIIVRNMPSSRKGYAARANRKVKEIIESHRAPEGLSKEVVNRVKEISERRDGKAASTQ